MEVNLEHGDGVGSDGFLPEFIDAEFWDCLFTYLAKNPSLGIYIR